MVHLLTIVAQLTDTRRLTFCEQINILISLRGLSQQMKLAGQEEDSFNISRMHKQV
jgi:hypothetical protein